jgi:tRNA(Ile)-lysidine synthase TilS/MesJ
MIPKAQLNSVNFPLSSYRHDFIRHKAPLISVSGGQDSILLALLIFQMQKEGEFSPLWLYHNHLWHAEGFFHGVHCWRLSIVFGWPFISTLPFQATVGEGLGWAFRYRLRGRLCAFYKTGEVLLGHTKTDRTESLLFHFLRGSLSQAYRFPEQRAYSLKTPSINKVENKPSSLFYQDRPSFFFMPPTFAVSASRTIRTKAFLR